MPCNANSRRTIRLTPNFRYTLRARPEIWHRLTLRVENFGCLFILANFALLAMYEFLAVGLKTEI
jgi:hypothetical protein